MKLTKLINRFFSKKDKEKPESVDEKNLGESMTNTNSIKDVTKKQVVKRKKKKYKYRITSPNNFKPIKHMKHGTSKLCNEIPIWAKNNSNIVIERLE